MSKKMKKKMIFTALMAVICLTANAQNNMKAPCDTAKCPGGMPIPGLKLTEENAEKFKDIFTRYMDEIKNVRGEQPQCCQQPGPRPEGPRPEGAPEGDKGAKEQPSEEQMDSLMKASFTQQRAIIDIQERYYDEFRTILTPQEVRMVYSQGQQGGQCGGNRGMGRQPQGAPGMGGQRPQMR